MKNKRVTAVILAFCAAILMMPQGAAANGTGEIVPRYELDEEYLYSPHMRADDAGEPDERDDAGDDDEAFLAESISYYIENGVLTFEGVGEGTPVIALYKDGRPVGVSSGSSINIPDADFDTLHLLRWNSLEEMEPVGDPLVLSYEQAINAPGPDRGEPRYGDIPNVYLEGDVTEMTKENRVVLKITYESATGRTEGYASAKWQGNAALLYPKKNFAVKLYKDEKEIKKLKTEFRDWDKSNNYVLKANYIDATSARNIVCARLYGKLPNTDLPNGKKGVVDGFPIRLYINGECQGLYTWNKPKKGWVFGMDGDDPNELLYFANYQTGSGMFRRKNSEDHYWEIVYPDDHTSDAEFDRVTEFVATCTDEEFRQHIAEYMDVESLLNYYVFSQIILHHDGIGKNMNMATYDGKIWYIRPYDMDGTFGLEWHGRWLKNADSDLSTSNEAQTNLRDSELWRKLEDNFAKEIYDRYITLRDNQLSKENILAEFRYFMDGVGEELYAENFNIWPSIPGQKYQLDQISSFLDARYEYLDGFMEKFNQ